MLDHLAILIIGKQNSGKTTTLMHFCNTYNNVKVTTFKQGWRYAMQPFAQKYLGVKIFAYFLPASRSERSKSLADTFEELEWRPDFLFMAEQLNGAEYDNSIRFLREKNYHIKEFILDTSNPDTIWHYYDLKDEKMFQTQRTEQIADYVRSFILSRI